MTTTIIRIDKKPNPDTELFDCHLSDGSIIQISPIKHNENKTIKEVAESRLYMKLYMAMYKAKKRELGLMPPKAKVGRKSIYVTREDMVKI